MLLIRMAQIYTNEVFTTGRERMVREQIKGRGIRNPDVAHAMWATQRHLFVPMDVQGEAYNDHPVPIGYGATISQPYVVALMTELLRPARQHRVLEIGTGSGYQAAVLAQLVSRLYTIEIVPELAESARRTLSALGYSNVLVRQGDGYEGWPEQAPFDRIIVTAAPSDVPEALIAQLCTRGRLVAPVGIWGQRLVIIDKKPNGTFQRSSGHSVVFLPMRPSHK